MLQSAYTPNLTEAGLDEVGRGCLAGPVVAAAVVLPKDYRHEWLTDSKQLHRSQRERVRTEILKEAVAWAVAEVSSQEIDRINILNASFLAMHRAVDALHARPGLLLVDGNRFNPYPFIPHVCIVKGDTKFLSIAAASVLAKTYRDELMTRLAALFPHYGWERNAAYPTVAHREAIRQHGITAYHRVSFNLSDYED
jgi:ribonuclease HII